MRARDSSIVKERLRRRAALYLVKNAPRLPRFSHPLVAFSLAGQARVALISRDQRVLYAVYG